jgi:hypothetical protein
MNPACRFDPDPPFQFVTDPGPQHCPYDRIKCPQVTECSLCEQKFVTKNALKNHIKQIHLRYGSNFDRKETWTLYNLYFAGINIVHFVVVLVFEEPVSLKYFESLTEKMNLFDFYF